MIRVPLSERELLIEWEHNPHRINGKKNKRKCSICTVMDSERNVLGTGKAKCRKDDTFKKIIGRRISLDDALKNTELSREERSTIWAIASEETHLI